VNFNSHMDAIVAIAVELVNALTPGMRHGRPYIPPAEAEGVDRSAAATAVLRAVDFGTRDFGRRTVSPDEAREFAEVAAELRVVFEAVAADDVDRAATQVNRLLQSTGAHPQLDKHDGEPWHLHFHGPDGTFVNGWAAGCATGLAVVLGSDLHGRLGVCTAPACDRVYVDVSRNGTRRFCSTACQNRVKTAAYRERGK
jgi:predicted RNA-binding Zn ribbon-like protein